MNVSIICPLYNAEKYIRNLDKSVKDQKKVQIESVKYVLTEGNDNTENILKRIKANYDKIGKKEFSHSLTREKAAMNANGDIIVFISQDVIIKDELWLYNLIKGIVDGDCEAAFSRQVCEASGVERYIRPINYPEESRIVSRKDIERLGLMTFFFSDASSAILRKTFVELNGYDNKNLSINEDMYIAYKLIMNDYKIKYCSKSIVIHSHKFTCKQLFKRYYDTGKFLAENKYLLKYGANKSGIKLAKLVLFNSLKSKDYMTLFNIIPNFASRFLGMQLGKRCKV